MEEKHAGHVQRLDEFFDGSMTLEVILVAKLPNGDDGRPGQRSDLRRATGPRSMSGDPVAAEAQSELY